MSAGEKTTPVVERPVGLVRGTRDWLPAEYARLAALERQLLDTFASAGYLPIRTPILEFTELHERKSGAGIVSKLFELAGTGSAGICLRPELTASIVRAFAQAAEAPPLPCRVSSSGPVFRYETVPRGGRLREFTQVGAELLGAQGPAADAEVVALAERALVQTGIADSTIRIGHVGLIIEVLRHTGLPEAATSALIEMLSAAAADGKGIQALESALDRLSAWLKSGGDGARDTDGEPVESAIGPRADTGVDRLFRHLVPDVTGRRSSDEIIDRLRRKWRLDRSLSQALGKVRDRAHALAELRGPARTLLDQLDPSLAALAPQSVSDLRELVDRLAAHGVDQGRVELDLGFGRGIGFYTQMIFELVVVTAQGPIEVCGGGRYDGLAHVLGSDRDDRGVGFAFGLERLAEACAAHARTGA